MFTLLYKLLKSLNSAQASWQVALAIVFAMISGFLPLFSVLNLIVLFFVFTISVPMGLYFALTAIFSILGSFLDPIFSMVGYSLLSSPSLEGFWTTCYNFAPALWTSFNHTTTLGSFVVALPLAVVLFFILKALIPKYRDLFEKLSHIKFLGWLNPYSEENLKNRSGAVRWWGALLFLLIITGVFAFALLAINPIIKIALEVGLSKTTGKDVVIEKVESSISDLTLSIDGFGIYEKGSSKGLVKIDSVYGELDGNHFLEKKIDVIDLGFKNLKLEGVSRSIDKNTEKKVATGNKEESGNTPKEKKKPFVSASEVDKILEKEELQSFTKIDEIKKEMDTITSKWEKYNKEDLDGSKYRSLERQYKSLLSSPIKTANDVKNIVEKSKKLQREAIEYKNRLQKLQSEYKADKKAIDSYLKLVKTLPNEEYKKLLSKYGSFEKGGMNFVSTYISPTATEYLQKAMEVHKKVEPYIQSEDVEVDRSQGRWIHFTNHNPYPNNYIRVAKGNVVGQDISYSLVVKDITDNQKILNKPTTGVLSGKTSSMKVFTVDFIHDTRSKKDKTTIISKLEKYKKESLELIGQASMNSNLINIDSKVVIDDYTSLNGGFIVDFEKTDIHYNNPKSDIEKFLSKTLKGVDRFFIDGKLSNTVTSPDLTLTSNLDTIISKNMNSVIAKEKKKFEKALKAQVEKKVKERLKGAGLNDNKIGKIGNSLNKEIRSSQSIENSIGKNLSQKSVESRAKNQAKKDLERKKKEELKKLEDKAKEKLKGLMNF
ncbi:MAG: TIGR03545 family protein [Campylobacterales bacterium]|nr:TIGR03545 family protein [Campylobacterales bacterium]